jgi:hypothetical protein
VIRDGLFLLTFWGPVTAAAYDTLTSLRCYGDVMRTTLSIDADVIERARALAAKLRRPFRTTVKEALRAGLDQVEQCAKQRPYKTEPHAMGLRSGRTIDNVQELLAQIEGEDSR